MIDSEYNLIDENWIPVVGKGKVGLKQIFSNFSLERLGGNPIEKISVFKLLLAIGQSAFTPKNEQEWKSVSVEEFSKKCLKYLDEHYNQFYLYGESPFLQMPQVEKATQKIKNKDKKAPRQIGTTNSPDLSPKNNTIITEYDNLNFSTDNEKKAMFLITVQNFPLYGKQVNNNIVLSDDLKKGCIAKPGASLSFHKWLHSFGLKKKILDSIYYNLFTYEKLKNIKFWNEGLGTACWDNNMPMTENCEISKKYKNSFLGHLVPLSRYVYYSNNCIYFSEGIIYHYSKSDKDLGIADAQWIEPSITWIEDGADFKFIQSEVEKKPWRSLSSLIEMMYIDDGYNNFNLNLFFERIKNDVDEPFCLWSAGLDVSGDSFGYKISQNDDFVESEVRLWSSYLIEDSYFYETLKNEMKHLDEFAEKLKKSVEKYYSKLTSKEKLTPKETKIAAEATNIYWQLCENEFQKLIDACGVEDGGDSVRNMRPKFKSIVNQVYNQICPNQTARQLEAWAECKPIIKLKEDR